MSTPVRNRLAMALTVIAATLTFGAVQNSGIAVAAGHNCPAGTNWDNSIQACW